MTIMDEEERSAQILAKSPRIITASNCVISRENCVEFPNMSQANYLVASTCGADSLATELHLEKYCYSYKGRGVGLSG